jgi:hypothetical protein
MTGVLPPPTGGAAIGPELVAQLRAASCFSRRQSPGAPLTFRLFYRRSLRRKRSLRLRKINCSDRKRGDDTCDETRDSHCFSHHFCALYQSSMSFLV